jgi:hypothetical protein
VSRGSSSPFEHSSHGLLASGRATGTPSPAVRLEVNFLGESPAALHVVGTRATDQPEWLPKSQIEMQPGALAAAKASRAAGRMALLSLSLPRWLAVKHGFAADVLEGQGSLW